MFTTLWFVLNIKSDVIKKTSHIHKYTISLLTYFKTRAKEFFSTNELRFP